MYMAMYNVHVNTYVYIASIYVYKVKMICIACIVLLVSQTYVYTVELLQLHADNVGADESVLNSEVS